MQVILIIIIAVVIILLITNIRIVPQAHEVVIERLGVYHTTWKAGLHVKIPIIDKMAKNVLLKEQVVDFPPQAVITKDNVTMHIDTVLFFTIRDSKLYTYGVNNPMLAIENLTATTLRNIVGDLDLDGCLTSRDVINGQITTLIDEASDPWGIKVNRVEVKNIIPPTEIQNAMEKQMKAEREKREKILRAEGEKESQILEAEGKREATVINAEAAKKAKILEAEAEKEAKILKAEADRIRMIKSSEGEAQSILNVKTAEAEGIRKIDDEKPSAEYLQIRALEAVKDLAEGNATKIITPSNVPELASILSIAKGITEKEKENNE